MTLISAYMELFIRREKSGGMSGGGVSGYHLGPSSNAMYCYPVRNSKSSES